MEEIEAIKLLSLTECVTALKATTSDIIAAAKQLHIEVFNHGKTNFIRSADLKALKDVLTLAGKTLPELMTITAAAKEFNLSGSTIHYRIKKKLIQTVVVNGRQMIQREELFKIIQDGPSEDYIDLQHAAQMIELSHQATRARHKTRDVRWVQHGRKIFIHKDDLPILAAPHNSILVKPGYVNFRSAVKSLGVTWEQLRQAILNKAVVVDYELVNNKRTYMFTYAQIESARRYFYPQGLTGDEVAEMLGVSRTVVFTMAEKNLLELTNAGVGNRKMISRASLECFLREKNGLTIRETADQLKRTTREVLALLNKRQIQYAQPYTFVVVDEASVTRYQTEAKPRTLAEAAQELGLPEKQVKYLLESKRLFIQKGGRERRISVESIQAFQDEYLSRAATLEEASRIISRSIRYIKAMVDEKKLKVIHAGRIDLVDRQSLAEYAASHPPAGYTVEEAAEKLGVSAQTVKRMIYKGRIKTFGKQQLITEQALSAYLAEKNDNRFVSPKVAAEMMGLPTHQIYIMIDKGQLRAELYGQRYRIFRTAIEQYLAELGETT